MKFQPIACLVLLLVAISPAVPPAHPQAIEGFHWLNQAGQPGDAATVAIVTAALGERKYSALREIGVVGDAALVLVTQRTNPAAIPDDDLFTIYAVGIRSRTVEELLTGYRLRFHDWLRMARDGQPEIVATYDDCVQCHSTSFLTTFYLDDKSKAWRARWPRNVSGAPLFASGTASAGDADHVYALMMREDGRVTLATWSHYERTNGSGQPQREDYLFEYMVDPLSGQGQSNPLTGRDGTEMKRKLCQPGEVLLGIAGGQDSLSCREVRNPDKAATRKSPASRHKAPSYIPPSKMVGRSVPPK